MKNTPLVLVLSFAALGIVQLLAFFEGLHVWLGLGFFARIIAFLIAAMLPFNGVIISVVAYIGATDGWGWEWWQAVLVCFPFVILSFLVLGVGGLWAIIESSRNNSRAAPGASSTGSFSDRKRRSDPAGSSQATSTFQPKTTDNVNWDEQRGDPMPTRKTKPENLMAEWRRKYKAAFIAIEYRPEAERAWAQIRNCPDSDKEEFLALLEEGPNRPLSGTVDRFLSPFEDPMFNRAYQAAVEIGAAAGDEFRQATEVLGNDTDPNKLLRRVYAKFAPDVSPPRIYSEAEKLKIEKNREELSFAHGCREGTITSFWIVLFGIIIIYLISKVF